MNTGRLKQFITHPAFISLAMLAAFLLVFPLNFPKYKIREMEEIYTPSNIYLYFSDLDNDGNSEKISFDIGDSKKTKIIVSRDDKVLKQYDLRFQPIFNNSVLIGDYNSDGVKEVFVFTVSEDSVFLNIIEPIRSESIILSDRFIDLRRTVANSVDSPNIQIRGLAINSQNNVKDLIFSINTGYSLQPRRLYRYKIDKDSLLKSPESWVAITECLIDDLNNDSIPEFLLTTLATGNVEKKVPFTDSCSWLMIINENLSFLFPPVEFEKSPSKLQAVPIVVDGEKNIVAFNDYFGSGKADPGLLLFDLKGVEKLKMPLTDYEPEISRIFPGEDNHQDCFYFIRNSKANIDVIDNSLKILRTLKLPEITTGELFGKVDADLDGIPEYLFQGANRSSTLIVRNNFMNPVLWQHSQYDRMPMFTHFFKAGEKPMLYAQFPGKGVFIRFMKNPFYLIWIPVYPCIYGIFYLFVLFIARGQQYRLNLRKEHEKKLVELQLKSIKNQIDPHFTLNVLNAIGSLYSEEGNKEKADYIFSKYAKLIRQTVISSDKVIVTIGEELDFVRNYMEIEKFRYGNSFDFSIDIRKGSDIKARIPRMLIHTFVENALKYGIRNMAGGGMLKIILQKNGNTQTIIIENNGPFLDSGNPLLNGTGKGLIILNDLIGLFQKLENIRITYNVENNVTESPESQVNRATILVPCMV